MFLNIRVIYRHLPYTFWELEFIPVPLCPLCRLSLFIHVENVERQQYHSSPSSSQPSLKRRPMMAARLISPVDFPDLIFARSSINFSGWSLPFEWIIHLTKRVFHSLNSSRIKEWFQGFVANAFHSISNFRTFNIQVSLPLDRSHLWGLRHSDSIGHSYILLKGWFKSRPEAVSHSMYTSFGPKEAQMWSARWPDPNGSTCLCALIKIPGSVFCVHSHVPWWIHRWQPISSLYCYSAHQVADLPMVCPLMTHPLFWYCSISDASFGNIIIVAVFLYSEGRGIWKIQGGCHGELIPLLPCRRMHFIWEYYHWGSSDRRLICLKL